MRPLPKRLLGVALLLAVAGLATLRLGHAPASAREPDAAKEPDLALQAAAALYEGVRVETLPNGLHVYLKPVKDAPVVTTMMAYKVGSADEELDHTGLSHYLEHLMFKGTDKLKPGDIDHMTLLKGGANNAYTSEDYTVYHFDFAADRWEVALEIEADRMRNLRIDTQHEFEQEKGAVISELESGEDTPWEAETKAILPLLFDHGPYGHPVIGERDHVRQATAAVIKAYYDRWYHPNNASLVICGGFDPERALARVKELFGPIPQAPLPERRTSPPAERKSAVRKEIDSKFEEPRMLMGFNATRTGEPDFYPLELIQYLLAGGKTSRLYRLLVEDQALAGGVDASSYGGRFPGWFGIQVELLKGKDRTKAENLVLAELKKLQDQPVSPAELHRVKQIVLAHAIFGRESVHALADSIARGVTTNDLEFLKSYLTRIQAVTAQEIQNVAKKYLDAERRVTVWSIPGERENIAAPAGGSSKNERQHRRAEPAEFHGFSLRKMQRVELPNGLTLVLFEDHRLPIVVAATMLKWVTILEPADKAGVGALTGMLLDEGTERHTGPQIAELIEDVGGSLSLSSSGGTVKVLTPHRGLGLGLLFECLTRANFPKEAFARKQAQLLSAIDDTERQPDAKAQRLYRSLAYGTHPFGRSALGRRETVEKLTPDDCLAFYRQAFVPNNAIVTVVGDFNAQQVVEEITQLTAGWKKRDLTRPETPAVEKPKEFVERIVTMPSASQLHFFMGHAGIPRNNPDYFKLLVMDYVLGTGPGFTDRLSARLRDRAGLAYTVSANITSSAGEEPGLFTCYIGTQPGALNQVKQMFLEELERIRNEKPRPEEVEGAKQYLLGNLPFHFTTDERIAAQLLTIERHHLGPNYLDDYCKAVAAVTPEDVQAVARKYLDPKHMVLVVAGAVDANGKPLGKLPPPKQ